MLFCIFCVIMSYKILFPPFFPRCEASFIWIRNALWEDDNKSGLAFWKHCGFDVTCIAMRYKEK